jgi:hypothetical protein
MVEIPRNPVEGVPDTIPVTPPAEIAAKRTRSIGDPWWMDYAEYGISISLCVVGTIEPLVGLILSNFSSGNPDLVNLGQRLMIPPGFLWAIPIIGLIGTGVYSRIKKK